MMSTSKNMSRNSAVELLRLVSISGIICMHIYGHVTEGIIDLAYYAFVNTIFNCGVSLFILISGFYEIKPTFLGGAKIILTAFFYSVLSYAVTVQNGGVFSLKELIRSMMPVSAGKYWFISAYFILFCFSDLLNKAINSMERKQHLYLILRFFLLFSLAPTVTFLHIMGDGGKGICNMLLMYIVGRYIGKYYESFKQRKYMVYVAVTLLMGTVINFVTGYLAPREGVPYIPLAKDSSVITIVLSVLIFIVIIRYNFISTFINRLAVHTFAIYLFEGALEEFFLELTNLWGSKGNWYYIFLLFLCAVCISLCCCVIDEIRFFIFIPIQRYLKKHEDWILGRVRKTLCCITDKL